MSGILIRVAMSALVIAAGAAAWILLGRATLARAGNSAMKLEGYKRGIPALVYFSSPYCVPCKAVQRPAVDRFRNKAGQSVQVIEVDVSARPEIAESWSVFSTPTTVLVDSFGRARKSNPGIASMDTLLKQARSLSFIFP
ncbi:MAG: hypothetical protein A2Z99_14040 [Treponema sp. GWB1_62_6]|nr:MAG: hypothetical protein A2Y36_18805 [Treponema sp. GWA1_62_8]OHE63057.1 MAG: hypothetical protein A2001_15480 [Treponema sp. GWC1_61_84]OHE65678.1 MAG: hypothetical protein A2Z99_14040 [Treponema sp. GWB1_62_6]OHE76795.1 MAG: hypothetical protein A2413_15815 [Treponema sp. RIFOXYC1_FULL_61_9]